MDMEVLTLLPIQLNGTRPKVLRVSCPVLHFGATLRLSPQIQIGVFSLMTTAFIASLADAMT
jgi:hypothetical protein